MSIPLSRVARSKTAARQNYNRLARWYDALAGASEEKYRRLGVQALAVQPGERVLEIGFGTGSCLPAFAQASGPHGRVYGLELSDGMLEQARKRIGQTRVSLNQGDAAQLPFQSASFDAIFMSFTLELIDTPEIPIVLAECRRCLVPDGRLALVSMLKSERPGLAERIYEWCHARLPVLVDCRPIQAQPFLQQTGYSLHRVQSRRMWGLPVEILLATRTEEPHPC